MFLVQNIIDNLNFVKNDFVSLHFNPEIIINFFSSLLISLLLMATFYVIGRKIKNTFFKEQKEYGFFISILLGYILTGTGIAVFGMIHLFRPEIIIGYLLLLLLIGIYPFSISKLKDSFIQIIDRQFIDNGFLKKNIVVYAVILFVVITFLRLLTPEIGEDGYHTDYPQHYLTWQSTLHESHEVQHVLAYPQLPEMIYTVPIILRDKEAVRFIHFFFYLLIVMLLTAIAREKKYFFAKFAPLLFVTAPAVIKYAPTSFTDFFAIFPFIIAALLIKKGMSIKNVVLVGICFGAVVSVKIWMLVYLPLLLIYLLLINRHLRKGQLIKMTIVFVASYLLVALLWHVRTIIIMGSPIYPIFNTRETLDIYPLPQESFLKYFGLNWNMYAPRNILLLSPLFFLGVFFSVINYTKIYKLVGKSPLFLFAILFTLVQIVTKVEWGRYLITWFIFVSIVASSGLILVLQKSKVAKAIVISFYIVIFLYYAINTVFLLQYGLGFADKNRFLTRTLLKQSGNYYDFNRLFDKNITKNDLVGTYGVVNYYYINFSYVDVGYIFNKKNTSFNLLKKSHITKLLIYGGDMKWFCARLSLSDCDANKYVRLATYPSGWEIYNLYSLK